MSHKQLGVTWLLSYNLIFPQNVLWSEILSWAFKENSIVSRDWVRVLPMGLKWNLSLIVELQHTIKIGPTLPEVLVKLRLCVGGWWMIYQRNKCWLDLACNGIDCTGDTADCSLLWIYLLLSVISLCILVSIVLGCQDSGLLIIVSGWSWSCSTHCTPVQ